MSLHDAHIKRFSGRALKDLRSDLQNSISSGSKIPLVAIRTKDVEIDDVNVTLHRVFVESSDSGPLSTVGWIANANIPMCLICKARFGLFTRRHHCRSCGNLICQNCSSSKAVIDDCENSRAVRICKNCVGSNNGHVACLPTNYWGDVVVEIPTPKKTTAQAQLSPATTVESPISSHAPILNAPSEEVEPAPRVSTPIIVEETGPVLLTISPTPGFVIKARRSEGQREKVFVNVTHHACIEDPSSSLLEEINADVAVEFPEQEQMTLPILYIGTDPSSVEDKDGQRAVLYNVAVSSAYFTAAAMTAEVKITDPVAVHKVLQAVNLHFHDNLYEDKFVLPKVKNGFKGKDILQLNLLQNTHRVHLTENTIASRHSSFVSIASSRASLNLGEQVPSNANSSWRSPSMVAKSLASLGFGSAKEDSPAAHSEPAPVKREDSQTVMTPIAEEPAVEAPTPAPEAPKEDVVAPEAVETAPVATEAPAVESAPAAGQPSADAALTTGESFYVPDDTSSLPSEPTPVSSSNNLVALGKAPTSKEPPISAMRGSETGVYGSASRDDNVAFKNYASQSQRDVAGGPGGRPALKKRYSLFGAPPTRGSSTLHVTKSLLTPAMLSVDKARNISAAEATKLKETSAKNAKLLLGWQVLITPSGGDSSEAAVYVITDSEKNNLRKTEYCLSNLNNDDMWVKLKRSDDKSGLEFTPLRKVLFLDGSDAK